MTHAAGNEAELEARKRRVRLVVFDFDGVLTDNTVLVATDGTESVRCWRSDGLGLRKLSELGLEMFVLSTETNPVVAVRCAKLGLPYRQGCEDKAAALAELAAARGLSLGEVAYVGNDINDLACLERVGLPVIVADAHPSVHGVARWRTAASGGRGAVREVCDELARVRNAPAPTGAAHAG